MMSSDVMKAIEKDLGPEIDKMMGIDPEMSAKLPKDITPDEIMMFQQMMRGQTGSTNPMMATPPKRAAAAAQPQVVEPTPEPEPLTEAEIAAIMGKEVQLKKEDRRKQVFDSAQRNLQSVVEACSKGDYTRAISEAEDVLKALKELDDALALPLVYPLMYDSLVKDDQLDRAAKFIGETLEMFTANLNNANKKYNAIYETSSTTRDSNEELLAMKSHSSAIKLVAAVAVALQQQAHHGAAADWWRVIYKTSPDLASTYLPLVDCLLFVRQSMTKKATKGTLSLTFPTRRDC